MIISNIPFTEPVIIITIILVILLIGPVFFERMRIPSLVGLLLSGAIIGPHGFNLVSPDLEFSLLGTIGLLYLMFLVGLEINIIDFIENKWKSIFIGVISFLVPLIIGFLVCRYLLKFNIYSSWLIAAMLSSHTLVSYPILGRLGIINRSIVTIIVGATIITDILALVYMELITDFAKEGFKLDNLLEMTLNFFIFSVIIFMILPRFSRFFFSKYEGDLGIQYIFVLVILFLSALSALLLKVEPIIGAFFSGLILNRQIFKNSPLYKRIEFIGNNLFIPFFIISIGILANFKVYINDPGQIGIALIFIAIAFVSKYIPAWIARQILSITKPETSLIFGLSLSRAASAIAIILIGFNMGIINEPALNNTVILILVTCIVSAYITQKAGKKLLVRETNIPVKTNDVQQKILVPLANPENMKSLLEFAILIKKDDENIPVYPLSVFTKYEQVRDRINKNNATIIKVIELLNTDIKFEISSRIDNSVTNGIVRAADEIIASTIIIGWNNRNTPFHILFGNVLMNLLEKTQRMLLVLKTPSEFRKIRKIAVFCPENAQYEIGFTAWLDVMTILSKRLQHKLIIKSESELTINAIRQLSRKNNTAKYFEFQNTYLNYLMSKVLKHSESELLIFIHSRKNTISYSKKFEQIFRTSMNVYKKNNIIIIYPEQ